MANAKTIEKLAMPERSISVTPLRTETPDKNGFKYVNELPTIVEKVQF